jgi:biofilm protein TabA
MAVPQTKEGSTSMIVTDLAHLAEQATLTPALRKALAFLQQIEANPGGRPLADGRIEIDGSNAYALVQSYETQAGGDWVFEGHRKYLDIQYVVSGEEVIGWAFIDRAAVTMPYDAAKDAWLGTIPAAEITPVRLAAGQLAVLYPTDAHAPKHAAGAPGPVKKIVVKVIV